jgi:hypothetical protein
MPGISKDEAPVCAITIVPDGRFMHTLQARTRPSKATQPSKLDVQFSGPGQELQQVPVLVLACSPT